MTKGLKVDDSKPKDHLFQTILDVIPGMMFLLDREGRYLEFFSSKYLRPAFSPEHLLGKKISQVMPAEIARRQMELIEQAFTTGNPQPDEYQMSESGEMLWYRVHYTVSGKDTVAAVIHDITPEKKAELELAVTNRTLWVLSECNKALVRAMDEPELLNNICRIIVQIGGYRLAWIGFAEKDKNKTVRPVAQFGFEEGYLDTLNITWADTERGRGPTGAAIRTGKPFICKNILTDPYFAPWRAQAIARGYGSAIALPLMDKNHSFGTLNIYAGEPEAFIQEEEKLLTELANDLSYGLVTLRAQQEHRKEEEALRREWEDIFQGIGHPALILTPDRTIIAVNRAAIRATGLSAPGILGKKCYEIFHKDDKYPLCCPMEKMTRSANFETETMEIEALGGHFFVSCTPVFNEHGVLQKAIHIATDITDRIKAEEALRKEEATLNSIFRAAPVGIGLVSNRILKKVNDRLCEMTGYTREELLEKSARVLYPTDEDFEYVGREKYRQIREYGTGSVETVWQSKDGKIIDVLLSSSPLNSADLSAGVMFTALDITERKRASEELEQRVTARTLELQEKTRELEEANIQLKKADQLKSVFLASMSHELRTPLNSIIGFTGILLMEMAGKINPEQKKQLTMVKNSANHLLNLINDILDISKIEAGRVDLVPAEFHMDAVIDEVKNIFSTQVAEKGLAFITDIPQGIILFSDIRRFKQILINLVSNAIKFTPQGSVTVTARRLPQGKIKISVADTGTGIHKDSMDKLFHPFQQIDNSLTKQFEGTGLGLYLCKSLVTLLDGEISAKSKYRHGSVFSFTLPLKGDVKQSMKKRRLNEEIREHQA